MPTTQIHALTARTLAGSTPTIVAVCTTASTLPSVIFKYLAIFSALLARAADVDDGPPIPNAPTGRGNIADQYCRRNSVAAL